MLIAGQHIHSLYLLDFIFYYSLYNTFYERKKNILIIPRLVQGLVRYTYKTNKQKYIHIERQFFVHFHRKKID